MLKAYKYRLYPTKEQTELLNKHFGCVRYIWNWALVKKTEAYQLEGKSLSRYDLQKELPFLKEEKDWLKQVNSQSLQAALLHLDSAYTRFFREKKGFPKFKSKKFSKNSFECPQAVIANFKEKFLKFPKLGKIKTVFSRSFIGEIKTVTVSKTSTDKFFASVLVEDGSSLPIKKPLIQQEAIGIDLGLTDFATLSNGEKIKNPRFLKKSLKKLKRLSKKHSKKIKGSVNRNKSKLRLARQYEKVTRQRLDFLHKTSIKLVRENQTICVETLSISNMLKNKKLSKAISDVSWGTFINMLEYKCSWYGKNLIKIGRFEPSSKLCTCGTINSSLTLKDRVWTCNNCGAFHDRDILAANNIVRFAFQKQNLIGVDNSEFTLEEINVN